NDLENDTERVLKMNSKSRFFSGFAELELENRIRPFLHRYTDFDFTIDYENWIISFTRNIRKRVVIDGESHEHTETISNIKVSRGEENMFIWCVFLAICELAIDGAKAYDWVKYFYIDDPISSLDDNNAIAVACDLSNLLQKGKGRIKTIISSHHSLFFNVICNELKKFKHKRFFLHKTEADGYTLRATDETPYYHHVSILSEIKQAAESDKLNTYHFNMLRSILEKTSTFFGFDDFSKCIQGVEDEVLYSRALNLLSHGKYSVYEPTEMGKDNKKLFKDILQAFLDKYQFDLPEILNAEAAQTA
ncbi:MAG: anticodon nuclease, partial [Chitinophagaceae bacterium]